MKPIARVLFVNPHAEFEATSRHAEREIQRMQVRGIPVDVAAEVRVGAEQLARSAARRSSAATLTTILCRKLVRQRVVLGDVARFVRDDRDAGRQIAVDREFG